MPLSTPVIIIFKNIRGLYNSTGLSKVNYADKIGVTLNRLEKILLMDTKALRINDIDNICEYHKIKINTLIIEEFYY